MIPEKSSESAVLVGVISRFQPEEKVIEYLDELEFLALTAGATAHRRFIQKVDVPFAATFIGPGKLIEVNDYVKENNISMEQFILQRQ